MKTREIADAAAAEGATPLEIMLAIMRRRWDAGDDDGALAAARDAGPYCHARLGSNVLKGDRENPLIPPPAVPDTRKPISEFIIEDALAEAAKSRDPIEYLRAWRRRALRREEVTREVEASMPRPTTGGVENLISHTMALFNETSRRLEAEGGSADD